MWVNLEDKPYQDLFRKQTFSNSGNGGFLIK